jgi:hypothetical protein
MRITQADAEHAARLARPHHRRDERAREADVRLVRHRRFDRRIVVRGDRRRAVERRARDPELRRELEADERGIESVYRRAPEHAALHVQQVAVGRVRTEQLRHLFDEALQHRVELQLARHDLRGMQQRRLLFESPPVLREEPRCLQRRADLVADGVDQELLADAERCFAGDRHLRGVVDLDLDVVETQRSAQLLPRDAHHLVGVDLRANAAHDVGDALLARERVRERSGRPHPVEGERRLGRYRLQQRKLVGGKCTLGIRRGDREHADHPLLRDHRDPRPAVCADELGEASADER